MSRTRLIALRGGARVLRLLGTLLVVLSAAGCASLSALVFPTPTATLTPVPTFTPFPTATPTPIASPTPTVTPSPTPAPLAAALVVEPAEVPQGSTGTVRVTSNLPARVTGTVDGRPLRFFTADGLEHKALVGIDAIAPTGKQVLAIIVATDGNESAPLEGVMDVVPGTFETEYLEFEPATEALLEPDIAQPEFQRMTEVFAGYTEGVLWQGLLAWPVPEPYVTSAFGTRRQYGERLASYHAGTDLRGATGTAVSAPAAGVVVLAEELKVRGRAVILDHGSGVFSGYFHMDSIAVEVGQQVAGGDQLGTVGATGLVTGSHLHWEMRVGGVAVNATEWTETVFGLNPG